MGPVDCNTFKFSDSLEKSDPSKTGKTGADKHIQGTSALQARAGLIQADQGFCELLLKGKRNKKDVESICFSQQTFLEFCFSNHFSYTS